MSAPPRFVRAGGPRETSARGTASLALGIGSIAGCVLTLGLLSLLTLPAGIVAVVLGVQAGRAAPASARQARAGVITGGVGIALSLLALALWAIVVAIGGVAIEFLGFWEGLEDVLRIPEEPSPIDPEDRIS